MSDDDVRLPQLLPVLSRGKHRSPKKGACFMELASFLAGERWSDHPACSHPLLAALARDVNDCTSDTSRQRLAELIPSVIGLTSDDPHVDALIALRCATTALPVVSAERQRAMAVAILTCNRVIANLDGRPSGSFDERSRQALVDVPEAARWARRFTSDMGPSPKAFGRHAARSRPARAAAGRLAGGLGGPTSQPRLCRPLPAPDHPRAQQAATHPSPDRHRRRDPAAPARRDHHRPDLGPRHRHPRHPATARTSSRSRRSRIKLAVGASPTRHRDTR
jgi:hypothetical protein